MITKIDHVGIAVEKLASRLPFWAEALGLDVAAIETVESEKVRVAFLPTGESTIELLEPTDKGSTVARFLAKRGEGIHHLTLAVDDLDGTLERLAQREVRILGGGARRGAGERAVAFLDPKGTGGVLIELVERRASGGGAISPGSTVLLYLREPQEKLWGVLRRLDGAGVVIEGIDLSSFDDWVAQIERGEESVVGPSVLFLPMTRLERILLDRSSGHLPSLAERFERRTGRTVGEVLADL
jgi:methylmalonyl-CoA/ethylmalonyl-CoA epimerase